MELLRSTAEPAENVPPDDAEAEGRGDQPGDPAASPARARRRRPAPAAKTKARNLRLSDDVHDRLFLLARQRKTTVSAVANELLDKALPRWEMKRLG
jgi:hypothetical protein